MKDVMFSSDDAQYASLDLWAQRLDIPVATLLHHAASGAIPLFFVPNVEAQKLRVIDISEITPSDYEVADPPPLPESSIRGEMDRPGKLVGICLEGAICDRLSKGDEIRMPFIEDAMWWDTSGLSYVKSVKNAFGRELPASTRIGIFPDKAHTPYVLSSHGPRLPISRFLPQQAWGRPLQEHLRVPASTLIQANTVCARDVDVSNFVRSLVDYSFIADIYDGNTISEDLPPYLSAKLLELVSLHRLIWSDAKDLHAAEMKEAKNLLSSRLERAFKHLCRERSNVKLLARYGATVCHPFSEGNMRLNEGTMVTPLMLALLTAAKLYWAPHRSDSGKYETRPSSKAIVGFLRNMGLKKLNEGRAGATLIEPEAAWEKEDDETTAPPPLNWATTPGTLRPAI